ncbi:MAG TPA: nucleotide sugar dehydrogenase, partial [Candidatus Norongarragalinales archaeon]|nr:nucleotide sugar dehydrogenase [Candidatus Norongarragalinales archaeon]
MKPSRIALFGLGKMGLPLACALANAGHAVVGVDVNAEWVARINRKEDVLPREPGVHDLLLKTVGKNFTATTDSDVSSFDFVILLVPTLIEETPTGIRPDLHLVFKVAEKIGKSLRKGTVVITECTLPPGSTEIIGSVLGRESGLFVGKDFGMAHCPERTSSGTALRDICGQYPKIVGASDPETLEKVSDLYASINSKGVIRMPSLSAAECVKVFEGIYRDVNIGLANELAKYCQDKGLDAFEIFQAANTQPFCHLHNPSCGVGGHCIPYYPYFVMSEKTP